MAENFSIPGPLKEALRDRRVIPFVGAGVSRAVKNKDQPILNGNGRTDFQPLFPNWQEFLILASNKLEEIGRADHAQQVLDEIHSDDYLAAAKTAQKGLGNIWHEFLKSVFDPDYDLVLNDSLSFARLIWSLSATFIITTNYDRVLRWACPEQNHFTQWDVQHRAELGLVLKHGLPKRPTVWHLHGHIDNSANIIISPDGYEKLYPTTKNSNIEGHYEASLDAFRTLLQQNSLLFIGFSMKDEKIAEQLRRNEAMYDSAIQKHYALLREDEKQRVEALDLPVEVIIYE